MSEITEDYCSFEVAKLLKEKGFNIPVWTRYEDDEDKEVIFGDNYDWNNSPMGQISAPTHQMSMKWLRKIYGIDIVIEITNPKNRKYYCMIWDENNDSYILDLFDSYEEAVEAALEYCLENLI